MVKAACQAGVAAEAGEREKDSSYKDIVSENGGVFYSLVVKVWACGCCLVSRF